MQTVIRFTTAITLSCLPNLALAGRPSFSFTPLVAPAPVADTALAVPFMSDLLLIIMGLLLVVVAVRTLRVKRQINTLLGVALLCGGLLVSGLGIDQAAAVSGTVVEMTGSACTEGVSGQSYPTDCDVPSLKNSCDVSGTVINTPVIQDEWEPGDCDGATLAPGESCLLTHTPFC